MNLRSLLFLLKFSESCGAIGRNIEPLLQSNIYCKRGEFMFCHMNSMPDAYALVRGKASYGNLRGKVSFYGVHSGTIVVAEITGLPMQEGKGMFHGFHIHEGAGCTGTVEQPFMNAGGHYNPDNAPHPNHAGDLPPLLSGNGAAYSSVFTDRFFPDDVIGRTVVIHQMPDDFNTQPSGNSGEMIACGQIVGEWGILDSKRES